MSCKLTGPASCRCSPDIDKDDGNNNNNDSSNNNNNNC